MDDSDDPTLLLISLLGKASPSVAASALQEAGISKSQVLRAVALLKSSARER